MVAVREADHTEGADQVARTRELPPSAVLLFGSAERCQVLSPGIDAVFGKIALHDQNLTASA